MSGINEITLFSKVWTGKMLVLYLVFSWLDTKMNVKSCNPWLDLLLMALVLGSVGAKMGLYLTKIECSNYAPEIGKNLSCHLNSTSQSISLVFSATEPLRNITGLYTLSLRRGTSITEYVSVKMDYCKALGGLKSHYFLKMVSTEIRRASNLPFECPLKQNITYYINEFTPDTKALPSYLPEMDFISDCLLNYKNKKLFRVLIHGSLVRI